MDLEACLVDGQLSAMLRDHALWIDENKLGDRDAGKVDTEGVHPVVLWHDWVSDSNVTAEACIRTTSEAQMIVWRSGQLTVTKAHLSPILKSARKMLLDSTGTVSLRTQNSSREVQRSP